MSWSRQLRAGAAGATLAGLLIVSLLVVGGLAPAAQAAVVSNEAALASSAAGDGDRARVADFLAREDVRRQLGRLGVDPAEAQERVALLTDAEAASVAGQLDELPAGGGAGLAIAITALVIVIILILELMGVIDIFTGIGPRR